MRVLVCMRALLLSLISMVVSLSQIDSLLTSRSDGEFEGTRRYVAVAFFFVCSRVQYFATLTFSSYFPRPQFRVKTEFLICLDGAGTSQSDRILIVGMVLHFLHFAAEVLSLIHSRMHLRWPQSGATNRPQDIDEAARRRMVKRTVQCML